MKKTIVLFAGIFLTQTFLIAQDPKAWTLNECIEYAKEHNISLERQRLNTKIQKKDFDQSKLNVLPNLNGQIEHNIGSGRVLDRGTYQWLNTDVNQGDLGLVSNLTLFDGFQGWNTIKMNEANYLASQSVLELYENNLIIQVMTGYLDLLRKQELFDVAAEKVKITEMQVERMVKLVAVGNASKGELLEIKAQSSSEKYYMTLAKNNMEVARLSLVQLMNLQDEGFEIEIPSIEDPSALDLPDLNEVYANALLELPQIEGAEHQITYQEKSLDVARGAFSPELYVRALYYTNYSDKLINPREVDPRNPVMDYPLPLQVSDNQYKQVSVGLNIPVFNKWQNRTNVSKAKIRLEDAQYQLEDEKQKLFKEIQQYHTDARAALDNYQSAMESVANSQEAYRYAEEKYKVGTATSLELEEARNRLFEARNEMISSKYVFVFYLKILDFYQGMNITFENL